MIFPAQQQVSWKAGEPSEAQTFEGDVIEPRTPKTTNTVYKSGHSQQSLPLWLFIAGFSFPFFEAFRTVMNKWCPAFEFHSSGRVLVNGGWFLTALIRKPLKRNIWRCYGGSCRRPSQRSVSVKDKTALRLPSFLFQRGGGMLRCTAEA